MIAVPLGQARVTSRYADPSRLPGLIGSSTQRQIATLKARITARYKLAAVPGRPDELRQPMTGRVVSIGYGCGTIRLRKHGGPRNRTWVEILDIQPNDGWHAEVYSFLDAFFTYDIKTDA